MEIAILAVGKLKAGPEPELCRRYLDRAAKAGRSQGFRGFAVTELTEGRSPQAQERMRTEGEGIAAGARGATLICLDEDGDLLGSQAFAGLLRRRADVGTSLLGFAIGGPDGLDPQLLGGACERLSLGRMTWPHGLVRVLLAEQLYRAMTILSGHPYHRA